MNWFRELFSTILEELETLYYCIKRNIHNAYYYSKCALFKRYNRLHIKTLPPTWCDRCEMLPHAMFQILEDFVRKECSPTGMVDWDGDEDHKNARKKMDELLDWWHNVYLKFDPYKDIDESKTSKNHFQKEVDEKGLIHYTWCCNEYENEFYKKVDEEEREILKELNEKLKEIVDLRPWLWT